MLVFITESTYNKDAIEAVNRLSLPMTTTLPRSLVCGVAELYSSFIPEVVLSQEITLSQNISLQLNQITSCSLHMAVA